MQSITDGVVLSSNFHGSVSKERENNFLNKKYDPNADYFMVSYHRTSDCSWIRIPFLYLGEVKDVVEELPMLISPKEAKKGMFVQDFTDLMIHSEDWLSKLHREFDEEQQKYVDTEITNRQFFYDVRYEIFATNFTGIPSLARQKDEPLEEWKERVAVAHEERREENLKRMTNRQELEKNLVTNRKSWGLEEKE